MGFVQIVHGSLVIEVSSRHNVLWRLYGITNLSANSFSLDSVWDTV